MAVVDRVLPTASGWAFVVLYLTGTMGTRWVAQKHPEAVARLVLSLGDAARTRTVTLTAFPVPVPRSAFGLAAHHLRKFTLAAFMQASPTKASVPCTSRL